MRYLLQLLLLLFSITAHADKPSAPEHIAGATNLSAEEVVELILNNPELVIVDARKEEEYAKGHIEGAVSLLDTDMDEAALAAVARNKEQPLLFYCNGERCLRSSHAATKAIAWGYHKVYWFRGGWVEWSNKNLPVAK